MSELFSESECVDTSLKADKLILSNTAIGLYSSNNNKNTIICEINLKRTTSDGPLKLVLKDDGSVEVWDMSQKNKIWHRTLRN